MGRLLKPWIASHDVVSGEARAHDAERARRSSSPGAYDAPRPLGRRAAAAALPWVALLVLLAGLDAVLGGGGAKRVGAEFAAVFGAVVYGRRKGLDFTAPAASAAETSTAAPTSTAADDDYPVLTCTCGKTYPEPPSRADSGYASSEAPTSFSTSTSAVDLVARRATAVAAAGMLPLSKPPSPLFSAASNSSDEDGGEDEKDAESGRRASLRSVSECLALHRAGGTTALADAEVAILVAGGQLPSHALEKTLGSAARAVRVRRLTIPAPALSASPSSAPLPPSSELPHPPPHPLSLLPHAHFDYTPVSGRCAENVVGYVPLPLGLAGPLVVDTVAAHVPMATTEGALIASTARGCKALNAAGGVRAAALGDGMTRGPVVAFPDATGAAEGKRWAEGVGFAELKEAFGGTTRHGALEGVVGRVAGRYLFLRFRARTGEAMGMNMMSKGVESALRRMAAEFPEGDVEVVSLSGNVCSDKKAAAVNWIEGRGKSVVAEAVLPVAVVEKVLKTTVAGMVRLGSAKNYVGSAMAGASAGGFNAHAANVVAAVFLATGQDAAQVVSSCNCMTMFEETSEGDLRASVTMPSLEVGTIGGGTELPAQRAMLGLMGVASTSESKGENAMRLAKVIAGAVLAGELSLCAALSTGELVKSHMKHNRKV